MKSSKVWGETYFIYGNDNFAAHRIRVDRDGYCSMHTHKSRWNLFYIESGALEIEVHKQEYDLVEKTLLTTGESMTVAPGDPHRFKALDNTIAYELYYQTPVSESDIQRSDVGGR